MSTCVRAPAHPRSETTRYSTVPTAAAAGKRGWAEAAAILAVTVAVSTIFGLRLSRQPIVGEETRWATGAREMLATGDWIVPRQQGQVFPERPPMTMWAMAAVGWLRGDVDALAIRLPSALAVVLTSLLVYCYTRAFATQLAALAAALAYPTFGQVLQIGRLGESEAVFALFVSGSLLIWHLGYMRKWRPALAWSAGFGCAALAALTKGPQAPVYFVAITAAYLAVRRDWRYLFGWPFFVGAAIFVAVIACWQIPFYLATDWPTVIATWAGLAADRVHLRGLAEHLVTYPLETFACLLPWSPLLVALAKRETRDQLADKRSIVSFLLIALLVAYPTVWIAAGARGRYFMPLYPLVAALIGLVIEGCALAEPGRYPRRAWHQFLLLSGSLIAVGGLLIGGAGLLPTDYIASLHQPRWFGILFGVAAAGAAYVLWRCYRAGGRLAPVVAVATISAFVSGAYTGVMINVNAARWNDPTAALARFKQHLPTNASLVSFSPISHRFAYYYVAPIEELGWPRDLRDLPDGVTYFCFMRDPSDTAASRDAGRGRTQATTPGTLPFAWEEIATLCVERRLRDEPQPTVVLGRVVRPLRAEVSDATVPQRTMAERPDRPPQR
jgi:4-amino-4-deoxy-L-arabinose transferase-like glycosyltransferase